MALARRISPRFTVEQFFAWAKGQSDDERYELIDGEIYAMGVEAFEHGEAKADIYVSLRSQLDGSDCKPIIDSMGVRTTDTSYRVPDVMVDCGQREAGDLYAKTPVVIVEVVSPSSLSMDTSHKLREYFKLPTLVHYLVVSTSPKYVIHYKRENDDIVDTMLEQGDIDLAPVTATLALADIFGAPA